MNIATEKEQIMKRINEEEDLSVIHAIKELLDECNTSRRHDEALERELDLSIRGADNGEELPAEEVMAEFRKKYAT